MQRGKNLKKTRFLQPLLTAEFAIEFGEKTQGYYAVKGHSRSSRSLSIESQSATSC